MKISLLSVLLMLIPVIVLLVVITLLLSGSTESVSLVLVYGFTIFFGWLTAIILGMTFKTLPFIVWNKVYHQRAGLGKTPNPKDLFSNPVFRLMSIGYLAGFILFSTGIMLKEAMVLQAGTVLLIGAAALYNWNVIKLLLHKPVTV